MQTRDFAHLGKTTWRAEIWLDNGHDVCAHLFADTERPNKGLIKAWVARELPRYRYPAAKARGTAWARVERGTYEDNSFDDDHYGHINDATWETSPNDDHRLFAALADNGVDLIWDDPGATGSEAAR